MKQLLAGIVLILVIGIGGFLYRNEVERPMANLSPVAGGGASSVACTDEAKVCPDGSAVGRTGPNCTFAACPPPNAELVVGSTTLDFVLPAGYTKASDTNSGALVASYQQSGTNGSVINIYEYPIPAGEGPDNVLLAETIDPSGLQATSTDSFKTITEGKNTFSEIDIGRFEGQVQTAYYLAKPNDVFRFDIIEKNVADWTDPSLDSSTLPEHQALQQMLATLQISS